MNGIQFITDDQGRKTAAVIDLKKHRQLWEDFYDGLIVESRRREKDIPFEEIRKARARRKPNKRRG
jgi:hypothetical protein